MEVDGVREAIPVAKAAAAHLDGLEPAVESFGLTVGCTQNDGVDDAPEMVAPATASGSGAAQPPRRPWCNHKPGNDMRNPKRARPNRVFAHMPLDFTCAPSDRHPGKVQLDRQTAR